MQSHLSLVRNLVASVVNKHNEVGYRERLHAGASMSFDGQENRVGCAGGAVMNVMRLWQKVRRQIQLIEIDPKLCRESGQECLGTFEVQSQIEI